MEHDFARLKRKLRVYQIHLKNSNKKLEKHL